jgi:hypothetical protein
MEAYLEPNEKISKRESRKLFVINGLRLSFCCLTRIARGPLPRADLGVVG